MSDQPRTYDIEGTIVDSDDDRAAFLVFCPYAVGTADLAAFGPEQVDEAQQRAKRIGGVVVQLPVLFDYTG